ncbi:cupin domain-containing protein [Chitinophaga barathri]|uniref:Cupin domain-containing protein n=1 Tax=Chitinophaga barathri TaxID=1647451 RepID=A0A3N4MLU4_9BACT|nr:cupin domain-containing protein [Chitinophaga barathri]RPD43036.1 cupin domain-containing protein [Chitinophaga barathri]
MKKLLNLFLPAVLLHSIAYSQQHDHHAATSMPQAPLSFVGIRSTPLSDPELKAYKMESSVMTIIPGGADTVSHRHDCELFGYVLEGAVEITLGGEQPKVFKAGEMFFEERNILHSLTRNPDKTRQTKILLIFIIKDGRKGYTRAYPEVKK